MWDTDLSSIIGLCKVLFYVILHCQVQFLHGRFRLVSDISKNMGMGMAKIFSKRETVLPRNTKGPRLFQAGYLILIPYADDPCKKISSAFGSSMG